MDLQTRVRIPGGVFLLLFLFFFPSFLSFFLFFILCFVLRYCNPLAVFIIECAMSQSINNPFTSWFRLLCMFRWLSSLILFQGEIKMTLFVALDALILSSVNDEPQDNPTTLQWFTLWKQDLHGFDDTNDADVKSRHMTRVHSLQCQPIHDRLYKSLRRPSFPQSNSQLRTFHNTHPPQPSFTTSRLKVPQNSNTKMPAPGSAPGAIPNAIPNQRGTIIFLCGHIETREHARSGKASLPCSSCRINRSWVWDRMKRRWVKDKDSEKKTILSPEFEFW